LIFIHDDKIGSDPDNMQK